MKLKQLADTLKLELRGDGAAEISMPAPIEAGAPGTIVFAAGPRYAAALRATKASCAIVPESLAGDAPCATLISANPYADFARVLEVFFPPYRPPAGIDPSARIAPDAKLGAGASVGAGVSIAAGTVIGRNAVVHPNVTIYPNVRAGDDFVCHSGVSIREGVVIGNRVTILNGAVIGAEGFGFVEHQGALVRIPQVGTVIIEDDVEIGANTTIARATMGATLVRRGVKLDNLVHIGHNCEVGEYSRFAAQVGLAGSVKVGRWCQFGGQVGTADHAAIGDRVLAIGQTGIHNEVKSDTIIGGAPQVEFRKYRRYVAVLPRLPEMLRRIRAIEQQLELRRDASGGGNE